VTAQRDKAVAFRALHERAGAFIIPNAWDAGSAKLLASLGFEAIATTSLGLANALGKVDGTGAVSRDELIANCVQITQATALPVSADLENCCADEPRAAARTITLAAQAGVVGGSIEDATGDEARPVYELSLAAERVQAAVEAARALPFPFVLTARADGLLHGRHDLDEIISAVGKPVNVVMSSADPAISAAQLAQAGVRRISVGGALSRLAFAAVMKAAQEMKAQGGFTWLSSTMPTKDVKRIFLS
jgi:2-methylisocitrate lyase-like PEP mutase family enzyme